MTLIICLPVKDGVVFASDGQITSGETRWIGTKIQPLGPAILWSGSGELALIQRVEERLAAVPNPNQPLPAVRDSLALIVKESVEELLRLDFRTQFFSTNVDVLLRLHPGDFVFAQCAKEPKVLHITVNGTPEWVQNRPFATGSGDLFAYALLQKYDLTQLNLEAASLLAFKVIEEAIRVGAYGLGPPIDVWQMSTNGAVKRLDARELAGLEDASRAVREEETRMFQRSEERPED